MNPPDCRAFVGETFRSTVTLSTAQISAFAHLSGDHNPLHHDAEVARHTRFGGIIASGTQTTALFMGMVASHFCQKGPMLGVEFSFRFHAPVRPCEELRMAWTVVNIEPNKRLGGLVTLEGQVTNPAGHDLVTGVGKVIVTDHL